MSNFDTCINRLLGNEGGYINDPHDAGGETNWGISKRSYPNADIAKLTKEAAAAIYKRDFWDVLQLDNAPLSIANQLLDFAVNSGCQTAIRALQRAVGVADDGHIGRHTQEALAATKPYDLVMLLLAERLIFMTNCKGWPNFGKGWAKRIANELKYGAQDV